MGCCGSSSKKPKNNNNEHSNNEHSNMEKNGDSSAKTVLIWTAVIILIAGLLVWMI